MPCNLHLWHWQNCNWMNVGIIGLSLICPIRLWKGELKHLFWRITVYPERGAEDTREEEMVIVHYRSPPRERCFHFLHFLSFPSFPSFPLLAQMRHCSGQQESESPLSCWETGRKEINWLSPLAEPSPGPDPSAILFPSDHCILRKRINNPLALFFIKQKTSTFSSLQSTVQKLGCSSESSEEHFKSIWVP